MEKKEKMNKEISRWDVSDIDPTTIFPKDCRFYNGGLIAPLEVRVHWGEDIENQKEVSNNPCSSKPKMLSSERKQNE